NLFCADYLLVKKHKDIFFLLSPSHSFSSSPSPLPFPPQPSPLLLLPLILLCFFELKNQTNSLLSSSVLLKNQSYMIVMAFPKT
ncbi:hypothetical protein V4Y02_23525, partial [Escherichia coli]